MWKEEEVGKGWPYMVMLSIPLLWFSVWTCFLSRPSTTFYTSHSLLLTLQPCSGHTCLHVHQPDALKAHVGWWDIERGSASVSGLFLVKMTEKWLELCQTAPILLCGGWESCICTAIRLATCKYSGEKKLAMIRFWENLWTKGVGGCVFS